MNKHRWAICVVAVGLAGSALVLLQAKKVATDSLARTCVSAKTMAQFQVRFYPGADTTYDNYVKAISQYAAEHDDFLLNQYVAELRKLRPSKGS